MSETIAAVGAVVIVIGLMFQIGSTLIREGKRQQNIDNNRKNIETLVSSSKDTGFRMGSIDTRVALIEGHLKSINGDLVKNKESAVDNTQGVKKSMKEIVTEVKDLSQRVTKLEVRICNPK